MRSVPAIVKRTCFLMLGFSFGCLMFNWPILGIATRYRNETGLIYLFAVWGLIIAGLAFGARHLARANDISADHDNGAE